ncbi:hypothetical protein BJ944DRAFT_289435 [Cunninghamella echinulata]|nr:hypothetical protein BJ944DRAFT_289435 [Cunninghamella echinulata]
MPDASIPNVSESFTRTIEQAWNRTLAVAQNHVQAYNDQNRPNQQDTQSNQPNNEFYDRERHMMEALDALFSYSHDGPGFLAFIQTLTMVLDSDSPVAMAFLSHVIERSSLPSKKTIQSISPVILSTMKAPHLKQKNQPLLQKMFKSFKQQHPNNKPPSSKLKLNATVIWSILAEKYAGDMCMNIWNEQVGQLLINMLADVNEDIMVRLFSLVALEKFSLTGRVKKLILETSNIQTVLLQILKECEIANNKYYTVSECSNEDFENSLNSLPLPRKQITTDNGITAQDIYWKADHSSQWMDSLYNNLHNESNNNNNNSTRWGILKQLLQNTTRIWKRQEHVNTQSINTSSKITKVTATKEVSLKDKKNKKEKIVKKESSSISIAKQEGEEVIEKEKVSMLQDDSIDNTNNPHYEQHKSTLKIGKSSTTPSSSLFLPSTSSDTLPITDENELSNSNFNSTSNLSLSQYSSSSFSTLNIFDTGFIPPPGPMRDEWAKYLQLAFCARWALENVFNEGKENFKPNPWDLKNLRSIMNPFDSTSHWKIGSSGLELRNDRPHFESIRATASVKTGKWYYEALLLSSGIMQLGWATSKCRFTPEEGYGVGDDCNGFAFDTYRTAVWADGTAVYPQTTIKIRCRAGDVLGSYLDLDNGSCSYYINGQDLGLTIEFENPTKQAEKVNAAVAANAANATEIEEKKESNIKQQPLYQSHLAENGISPTSTSTLNSSSTPTRSTSKLISSQNNNNDQQQQQQLSSYSNAINNNSDSLLGLSTLETASFPQQSYNNDDKSEFNPINTQTNMVTDESSPTPTSTTTIQSNINMNINSNDQSKQQQQTSEVKSAKGLGLYPAVSLTTHQHIIMNLGDRPWIYPPPIPCRYRGICEAGQLDDKYKKRVSKWVSHREYRMRKSNLADNNTPIRPKLNSNHSSNNIHIVINNNNNCNNSEDQILSSSPLSSTSSTTSSSSLIEYDWDGPMCTICFSESKNVILLPCRHGGIGQNCAKALDMCPLCRANIEDRIINSDNDN